MSKIVLYLEDEANIRSHTVGLLIARGYDVQDFRRIDQVKEYFTGHKNDVVCIITDLNMSDEWLGEYLSESEGGMFSGWVWLQRFVYTENPNVPTIIYSGYIDVFNECLDPNDSKKYIINKNIIYVKKGSNRDEGFKGLLTALQEHLPNYSRGE